MMNNILKAADEVKKLARMFGALGEVVEILDRIGGMEQAEQEARARVDALNRDAEFSRVAVDSAKAEAKAIKDASAKLEGQAAQHTEALKAAASDEAKTIVARARTEADTITEAARLQVKEAEHAAVIARDAESLARSSLADLEQKIEGARARIAKLLES